MNPAVLKELRARIAAVGRGGMRRPAAKVLPLGAPEIDGVLPGGGLPLACIHEVVGADGGAAALGFVLALLRRFGAASRPLPVLWCLPRSELYGPGLAAFGFDPRRLVLARVRGKAELLWAMEEGLRSPALAAVVAETGPIGAKAQRRLQLAAETGGVTGFLLREAWGGKEGAFLATSWRLAGAPGGENGAVRWRAELVRCRGGNTGSWLMEWNHETGDLAVAAAAFDRPDRARPQGERDLALRGA
jgi:protein ImuA